MTAPLLLLLLLCAPVLADPLASTTPIPAAPVRPPDHAGDCTAKAAAPAGAPPRSCDAISVPPSYLAHLEATRVYADQLQLHLVAAQAVADADSRSCADALAWRDQVIADQRRPVPLLQRPGVQVGVGVVGGALLTVGAGWALGQVSAH